jgi:hypothetical protein
MADITKVKLGVCDVTFNSVNLGHTKGGVTVSYEPEYVDIQVDKYGKSVAEKVLVGESLKVTVPLAESALANIEIGIPAATDVGPSDRATIGKVAGLRMAQFAHELVLHPSANGASDRSEDVVLYKALAAEAIELKYGNEGERVMQLVFHALIDETKSDGNYLGLFGDSV